MKILYSLAWEIDPFEPILDTFPGITLIKAQAKNDFGPTLEDADGIILSATHYNAGCEGAKRTRQETPVDAIGCYWLR